MLWVALVLLVLFALLLLAARWVVDCLLLVDLMLLFGCGCWLFVRCVFSCPACLLVVLCCQFLLVVCVV